MPAKLAGYPADRQITGAQYRRLMEHLIGETQSDAGWKFPWLVAQATFHSAHDSADAEFRAAQKSLWDDRIAEAGPDTDALGRDYRDGVHFNAKGLKAHGELWAKKVEEYLDQKSDAAATQPTSSLQLRDTFTDTGRRPKNWAVSSHRRCINSIFKHRSWTKSIPASPARRSDSRLMTPL